MHRAGRAHRTPFGALHKPSYRSARDARETSADGQTVMFLSIDGKLAGLIGVADPTKQSTFEAIRALQVKRISI